ncbi:MULTISPECIES: efflux RND transporter periplasmic adaptor subunit [Pseudomonadaceae]|uniref:Membrane fusion protein, cobalt-zinc-cadmium efflux system n=1 Tax=Halopseudomonas litoralis TaxID=797277 RepID=A0A1H1MRC1_9GAMM|nr:MULTISPECIES: efflux RND transporter periplasmic adaptor subunit [Pseudomonadaceae]QIB50518.1 HlyD family efflux transporter periplasmic adaptor subunit [Pseudomonas sp. OIL-1]SDR88915.1 membrane fusion protein, cobalt-zinc-cadmium efflux system [Halopseudomonas litoralis]
MNKLLNLVLGSLLLAGLPLHSAIAVTDPKVETRAAHTEEEASHQHESEEPEAEAEHSEEEHGEREGDHAAEEAGHDDHDGHAEEGQAEGHEGHEENEEPVLTLSADLLREFGGEIAVADAGVIRQQVSLPGEIQLNKEAVAHISPRFAAKIVEVRAKIGDKVSAGETLAVAESSETLARFNLTSLIDGVVINRDVTLGEHLSPDDTAFVVADVSTLWADIALYPKQVPLVEVGQPVRLSTSYGPEPVDARIDYVAPSVDERTRTGLARVFLPNESRAWKPGMFVQSDIAIGEYPVDVVVPEGAIIDLEGQPTVFVQEGERWEPRSVKLGRDDGKMVEVLSGLEPGESYIAEGGFVLKAQLQKNEFESGHNH